MISPRVLLHQISTINPYATEIQFYVIVSQIGTSMVLAATVAKSASLWRVAMNHPTAGTGLCYAESVLSAISKINQQIKDWFGTLPVLKINEIT